MLVCLSKRISIFDLGYCSVLRKSPCSDAGAFLFHITIILNYRIIAPVRRNKLAIYRSWHDEPGNLD